MDGAAFDRLAHRLSATARRRALLAGLAGAGLAGGAVIAADDTAAKKKKKKTTICRGGQTLSVVKKKKQKHLKPGDTAGACPAASTTARPGTTATSTSSTTATSTTSGPTCPDLKPGDDLQAAIDAAAPESTLQLCPGTFRITSKLIVGKDLTIIGAGVEETILDGEDQVPVLQVERTTSVMIQDLTITRGAGQANGSGITNKGDLTLRRMAVTACTSMNGGGISNIGVLTLGAHCVVERNKALIGEGVGYGAGIANAGTLIMNEGSLVTGNTAASSGGGILNYPDSHLTMNGGSVVTGNVAEGGFAGGIYKLGGTVTLNQGSRVEGNDPDDCEPDIGSCH